MKKIKNEHFPYSILHADIICEHKLAQIDRFSVETMHDHDGYEILLFLSGEANIIVESEEKRLCVWKSAGLFMFNLQSS